MPLFSFFIIGIYIFFLTVKKVNGLFINSLAFCALINIHIGIGYFINIGSFDLYYYDVVLFLTCFISILELTRIHFPVRYFKRCLFYVSAVIVSLLMLIINPVTDAVTTGNEGSYTAYLLGTQKLVSASFVGGSWKSLVWIIMFSITVFVAFSSFSRKDWYSLLYKLSVMCKIVLVFCMVELVLKYIFSDFSDGYYSIIKTVFGTSEKTIYSLIYRYSGVALQGLTREPSHYVYALMITILVLWVDKKVNKSKNIVWIGVSIICMYVSTSFSMVIGLGIPVAFYILYSIRKDKRKSIRFIKILFCIIIVLTSVAVFFISEKNYITHDNVLIHRLFSSRGIFLDILTGTSNLSLTTDDSSITIRLYSVINTVKLLRYRPLFGMGLATTTCHGSAALLIAELGIIGTITCILFQFFTLNLFNFKFNKFYIMAVVIWFVSQFFLSHGDMIMKGVENIIISVSLMLIFEKIDVNKEQVELATI